MDIKTAPKKRILCVEDEHNSSEFLIYLLSDYEIVFSQDKDSALNLLISEKFDLCLLDYSITEGEGVILCRQIKALDSNIPIIFTSGIWQKEEIQKVIEAGATKYLIKPYSIENLQQIIKELIEKEG